MLSQREELLVECTVRISGEGLMGTGCFVAPGLILTCAHVVEAVAEATSLRITWKGERYPVTKIRYLLHPPDPDIAVLEVALTDHPCILLRQAGKARDNTFVFGYTDAHPDGESATPEHEGVVNTDDGQHLIKLKHSQIRPGFSGAPLLHLDSGVVCGLLRLTRDEESDLGGAAIPAETICAALQDIVALNLAFHAHDRRWTLTMAPATPAISRGGAVLLVRGEPPIAPPRELFGRAVLHSRIERALRHGGWVLLAGMTGMGKTAIAATVARDWLAKKRRPILWVEAGPDSSAGRISDSTELIEQCAQALGQYQEIISLPPIARGIKLGELLTSQRVRLVIVNDARNGAGLYKLLEAIPKRIPLLITSRQLFQVGRFLVITEVVDELEPEAALDLLSHHAEESLSAYPDAAILCKLLGYHPYALEIAGARINEGLSATDLIARIGEPSELLVLPDSFGPIGRGKLWNLLDESFEQLSSRAKIALLAFGRLYAATASTELLTEVIGPSAIEALNELVRFRLLNHKRGTHTYLAHDLTFLYARDRAKLLPIPIPVSSAIEHYLTTYAHHYDLIAVDMPQILGAAIDGVPDLCIRIMCWLTAGSYPPQQGPSYFGERGYSRSILEVLDRAILTTDQAEESTVLHYLQAKRADAHYLCGEYQQAIHTYSLSLSIAPSPARDARIRALLGRAYTRAGQYHLADNTLNDAHDRARRIGDPAVLNYVISHRSAYAGERENYPLARELAIEAYELACETGDEEDQGHALINWGSSIKYLEDPQQAITYHQRALDIAKKVGTIQLQIPALRSLGEDYAEIGEHMAAQQYLSEAIALCRLHGFSSQETYLESYMRKHQYPVPET
jgi:tetratricopeptide (TPR) repeat protein